MTAHVPQEFVERFPGALDDVPDEELYRDSFVPGFGPLDAEFVLVGEAPGVEEVNEGVPFVGKAGRRLSRLLETVGVDRDRLYLTNAVKTRPERDAEPTRRAIDAWHPVLWAEIEAVAPERIVALGDVATRALLSTDEPLTEFRGEVTKQHGQAVYPTYHPAATLYDEGKRDALLDDLCAALNA